MSLFESVKMSKIFTFTSTINLEVTKNQRSLKIKYCCLFRHQNICHHTRKQYTKQIILKKIKIPRLKNSSPSQTHFALE